MAFILTADDPKMKLKSFSGTVNSKTATLRITVSIENDGFELGYVLRQLKEIEAEQKRRATEVRKAPSTRKATPRKITKEKQLALPAPSEDEL
ncbi:MAG: hypothetical protein OIF47_00495 [Marinibacterium sp.]|nr:hypothetical protein [Marinibacterium sp.]